jgi:hypothetical protein
MILEHTRAFAGICTPRLILNMRVYRIWSLSMATCVGTVKGFKGINSMSLNSKEEILAVCTHDSRVLVMGTQEVAKTKAKEKSDRESSFIKEGGELWCGLSVRVWVSSEEASCSASVGVLACTAHTIGSLADATPVFTHSNSYTLTHTGRSTW